MAQFSLVFLWLIIAFFSLLLLFLLFFFRSFSTCDIAYLLSLCVFTMARTTTGAYGISFNTSLQTPLLRANPFQDLNLVSPTRSVVLKGPRGVWLESRAADITATCLRDFMLKSHEGKVSIRSHTHTSAALGVRKSAKNWRHILQIMCHVASHVEWYGRFTLTHVKRMYVLWMKAASCYRCCMRGENSIARRFPLIRYVKEDIFKSKFPQLCLASFSLQRHVHRQHCTYKCECV